MTVLDDPVMCAALRDVALIWAGKQLPSQSPRGPKRPRPKTPFGQRVTRGPRARPCLVCGQFGATLRFGNRCAPCYRMLVRA
jgi:hypothetical protein